MYGLGDLLPGLAVDVPHFHHGALHGVLGEYVDHVHNVQDGLGHGLPLLGDPVLHLGDPVHKGHGPALLWPAFFAVGMVLYVDPTPGSRRSADRVRWRSSSICFFGFGVMVLLQVLFDGLPLRVRAPCHAHCYTSVMSIPKRSFSNFFFMAYSLVRVARLFTSSTTCTPLGALVVCKISPVPDGPHPAALRVRVCLLEGEVNLQTQVPDLPAPFPLDQEVIPAGLLLAVEPEDGPGGRHPCGGVFRYLFTFLGSSNITIRA